MNRSLLWILFLALPFLVLRPAPAGELEKEPRRLVVGTKEAAPFSFKSDDGTWRGISIDLWRAIARDLELDYDIRELTLEGLVEGLGDGTLDIAVAALTVTAERELFLDFTHPIHPSGLGIAVPAEENPGILAAVRRVFSFRFFQAILTLMVLIFVAGALIWVFERRKNKEQFGGKSIDGLAAAFWWSAVTMTTVGYGDKAPMTLPGRIVALVWMFASIITISGLTAAIASTLTVSKLESSVRGPQDLPGIRKIVTVRESTSEPFLRKRGLPYSVVDTALEAMTGVAEGRFGAMVYDAPILRYLASTTFEGRVMVLPATFERQDYAFGLPLGSPLRKPVNKVLLKELGEPDWDQTLYEYLGTIPPGR